jgi:hypothetical protein
MVLSAWAADDPASASAWVTDFPAGEARQQAITKIAESWAGIDPQSAVSWTLTLPDSLEKNKALDQSVRIWALNERDSMSTWLNSQSAGDSSDHLRSIASIIIAENHPIEGAALAVAISNPLVKRDAIVDVIRQWQKTDSKAANEWINQQSLDAETLDRIER